MIFLLFLKQITNFIMDFINDILTKEISYCIFKYVSPYDHIAFILTCKTFYQGVKTYNKLIKYYGNYVLSSDQTIAINWITESLNKNNEEIKILKAPPSWGKTAFSLALGMELAKEGKQIWILMPGKMVETYVKELENMYPDEWNPHTEPDESLICFPHNKASKLHNKYIKKKNTINKLLKSRIILVTHGMYYNLCNEVNSIIDYYGFTQNPFPYPDVILFDEAHTVHSIRSLFNSHHTNMVIPNISPMFVLMSASEIDKLHMSIVLFTKNCWNKQLIIDKKEFIIDSIIDYIPDSYHEIALVPAHPQELRSTFNDNKFERRLILFKSRIDPNPNRYLKALDDMNLKGRTVVFGKKSNLSVKMCKNSIVYNNNLSDLDHFRMIPVEENPILFITYGQGAEGLNIDMVENIVLIRPDIIPKKKYYQSIHRTLRVYNKTKKVRVINLITDHKESEIYLSFNQISDDFLQKYMNIRNIKNEPSIIINNKRIKIWENNNFSIDETYILFHNLPKRNYNYDIFVNWLKNNNLFSTIQDKNELIDILISK